MNQRQNNRTMKTIDQVYDPHFTKKFKEKSSSDFRREFSLTIHAVGRTVEEAIRALAKDGRDWKNIKDIQFQEVDTPCKWYVRFWANGVSMKAAGEYVNGGVILTWWK